MSKSYNLSLCLLFPIESRRIFKISIYYMLKFLLTEVEPVSDQLLAPQKIKKIFLIFYSYTKIVRIYVLGPEDLKIIF